MKPKTEAKRVAIIGAGSSGSCAAKYALENGLEPTVLEKSSSAGGLWASTPQNRTAAWQGLHANISYFCMSFSGLRPDKSATIIPSCKDVLNYIESYIDHFNLRSHIRLNTKVERVSQLPDKKWKITTVNTITNEEKTEIYDFLIVASGLHADARIPTFENMNSYKGLIIHSSKFQLNDERLKDKKVLVVGGSYSGSDISAYLVGHARSVTNVFRRPYLITPRFVRFKSEINKNKKGSFHVVPNDFILFRRLSSICKSTNKEDVIKFNLEQIPVFNVEQTNKDKCPPALFYDLNTEVNIRESISDDYFSYVNQGKIVAKRSSIKRFEEDGVLLEDGSFEKADAVILCTGFYMKNEYFDKEILDLLEYDKYHYKVPYVLYKFTFHPVVQNLAMVCQNDALFFTGTELQCKWASLVFSNKLSLPSNEIMEKDLKRLRDQRKMDLRYQYPFSHNEILDTLAGEMGVLPDFDKLKENDPELYDMLWNNPAVPAGFFINDDAKEKRELAMNMLREVDRLAKKEYMFDDDDETVLPSVSLLAKKFAEANQDYNVPFHLFRT